MNKPSPSPTEQIKKIEKLDMTDSSIYVGWSPGATSLPDLIDPDTKQAIIAIQDKINEIIDYLNTHD
jgi:hypothetical protein